MEKDDYEKYIGRVGIGSVIGYVDREEHQHNGIFRLVALRTTSFADCGAKNIYIEASKFREELRKNSTVEFMIAEVGVWRGINRNEPHKPQPRLPFSFFNGKPSSVELEYTDADLDWDTYEREKKEYQSRKSQYDIIREDIPENNPVFNAIPSPIKPDDLATWEVIRQAYLSRTPINATIKEVTNTGFNLDLGCGIESFHREHWYNATIAQNIQSRILGHSFPVEIYSLFNGINFAIQVKVPGLLEKISQYSKEDLIEKIVAKETDIFIFGTSAVMDDIEFMANILEAGKDVYVPYVVLEELDGLKDSADTKKAAKARSGLVKIQNLSASIHFAESQETKLPKGLDRRKNDNAVIAIALDKKADNPVIVTGDIGIKVKAKALNIGTWP